MRKLSDQDRDAIYRVLLLKQVQILRQSESFPKFVYFFVILPPGENPSAGFLRSLGKAYVPGSLRMIDKHASDPFEMNIIHKRDKKPGVILSISSLKREASHSVTSVCGHSAGLRFGFVATYHLKKALSGWQITAETNVWLS